jgi:ABC-type cobalamin/Fe3+-siderophores transport system ATPase subunit
MNRDIYDALKMSLIFNNQNNIFMTFIIIIASSLFSTFSFDYFTYYINRFIFQNKVNKIILTGKTTTRSGEYTCRVDNLFSNRFKAMWFYINSINNETINSIKEYSMSCNNLSDRRRYDRYEKVIENNNCNDLFIVNQNQHFLIENDIYCKVKFINIDDNGKSKKCSIMIEDIVLEIFTSKYNMSYLSNYINEITEKYISQVENDRKNKLYIYTLKGNDSKNRDEYFNINDIWEECEFNSTRNFNNLFFDNKFDLISKIDFFKNNKYWYEKNGHPYTLGIGLYGPPGTGKTSVIKCIANMLKRHLIVINLNKITTQREFSEYYFEKTYNSDNKINSIDFDNKIIVLEDIDCMCEIVKKRNLNKNNSIDSFCTSSDDNSDNEENIKKNNIKKNNKYLAKQISKNINNDICYVQDKNNDKITLSYLLNVIDGIRETPGRILIITSNHYNQLDEALIRPGRIDIKLEMKNASVNTISQMYCHYYDEVLDTNFIEKLEDHKISPAQITNIYLNSKNQDEFKNNLLEIF